MRTPAGWKLVPEKATQEMWNAVEKRHARHIVEDSRNNGGRDPELGWHATYEAMIGAAPTPPYFFAPPHPGMVRLTRAVIELLAAVDDRFLNHEVPLKYTIPYGAVNELREALGIFTKQEPRS